MKKVRWYNIVVGNDTTICIFLVVVFSIIFLMLGLALVGVLG